MGSDNTLDANDSNSKIEFRLFVSLVRDMLTRLEYLFPYIWAQRQYRSDSYQMASAGQLEDLFHDTFGTYLNHLSPGTLWERRRGKEKWDFRFGNTGISHKEGLRPVVAAFWTAGQGPGYRTPMLLTWNFEHAISFSYTPLNVGIMGSARISGKEHKVRIRALNHKTLQTAPDSSLIGLGQIDQGVLQIDEIWSIQEWRNFTVHDVRRSFGKRNPLDFDFWILDSKANLKEAIKESIDGLQFAVPEVPLLPGIYFLEKEHLQGVHLTSNNRAHLIAQDELTMVMKRAVRNRTFISMPLWPGIFADMRPANLYAIQRRQFDEMFAPRE